MIKTFFIKKGDESSVILWLFCGPFFLIINTIMATLFLPISPLFLSSILFGLTLSVFGGRKGFLFSLVYLTGLSIYLHSGATNQASYTHLWQLGVEVSVVLGLLVTYISFHDAKALLLTNSEMVVEKENEKIAFGSSLQEEKEHFKRYKKDTQIEFLDLQNEKEKQFDLLHSYRKLSDILSERDQQAQSLKESYITERTKLEREIIGLKLSIDTFRKKLSESEQKKKRFLFKANELRHQLCQKKILFSHGLLQARKKAYFISQKLEISNLKALEFEEKLEETKSYIQSLCKRQDELCFQLKQSKDSKNFSELKKQFQEKNNVLHETRKEVFQLNEKIASYQMKEEEKKLSLPKDLEKAFLDLERLEEENAHLKKDNLNLSALVTKGVRQKNISFEKEC